MMKKTTIAALAAATLAVGATAFAGGPDQVAQTPAPTYAGAYIEGALGVDWESLKNETVTNGLLPPTFATFSPKDKAGFAARVAVGYDFNQYVGVVVGFNHYHSYKYDVAGAVAAGGAASTPFALTNVKRRIYTFDAMVKGMYPINQQFFVFAEAGGAYVNMKYSQAVPATTITTSSSDCIRPKVGGGVGYRVNSHVTVDATYTHVFRKGHLVDGNNYFPGLNAGLVGVSYKF